MPPTQPDGYLALPPGGAGAPALVLHAWWGLNDTIKGVCARLAEAGFIAFAPDLYHGTVVDTIPAAEAASGALFQRQDQAQADLAAAIAFLSERAGADDRGLTVMGFSLGASFALDLAAGAADQVRAVVVFYGTGGGDFSKSQAAYLGHFAETDPFEPPEEVDRLEEALRAAGRPVTFYRYPGVGHWFFEPDRADAYDAAAAGLAWDRTLAFLQQFGAS
jgi:carboxymethylenebutenolidase